MNNTSSLSTLAAGFTCFICCLLTAQATPEAARPNVLIMIADDLGYADLGVQGCTDVPTPNLDSIAKNGVRFTSGYVSAPVCSHSRAAQKPPHEALFWRCGTQMAVRAGDWKLTKANDKDVRPPALKTGLYLVAKDAAEQNDLATQHPGKVQELQKLWDDWNK